jgi:16S rRNA (guanine527-N7)-methyltransferase
MYLIEPTQKKCAFLKHIVRRLGLMKTEVIAKRIEEVQVTRELSSPVDFAISRALFDVKEFIKKASHILKPGGKLVLNKGPKVTEELETLGDTSYELLDVGLPLSQITRHIIIIAPKTESKLSDLQSGSF